MSNLSQDELTSVVSRKKAIEGSKGYDDKSLVLDLIAQFKTNLPNRLVEKLNANLSQRQIHLLLSFLKISSTLKKRGGYIGRRLWWW
jgi:hypothetical protein